MPKQWPLKHMYTFNPKTQAVKAAIVQNKQVAWGFFCKSLWMHMCPEVQAISETHLHSRLMHRSLGYDFFKASNWQTAENGKLRLWFKLWIYLPAIRKLCMFDWRNSSLCSQAKLTEYGDNGVGTFYTNCPCAERKTIPTPRFMIEVV